MLKFVFDKKTIKVPNHWDEVTVEHFINPFFLSGNSLSLLSVLSGIEKGALINSTEDITPHLYKMVNFVNEEPQGYKKALPEEFELRGQKLTIPKDIEVERVGQKIMLQDAVFKYEYVYQAIPEAIAIYMAPQLNDGVFDDAMIEPLAEEVKQLRIVDVYPIADFFLSSSKRSTKNGLVF